MTPLQIQMLFAISANQPIENLSAPSQCEAMIMFEREGLVVRRGALPGDQHGVKISERGEAYLNMLCNMPLPVVQWVVPGQWIASLTKTMEPL